MPSDFIMEVHELNGYVKRALDADPMLRGVRVRGEISSMSRPNASGHLYFTLKDMFSQLPCVMFRQDAMRLSIRPENGQRVIVSGSVSLYPEAGKYQMYVRAMRPDGVGSLYEQYEKLRLKLKDEGLFDAARKRPLPAIPRKIAVVTAASGAVIHDICRVARERNPYIPIVLVPSPVQGIGAAEQIARAVRRAGRIPYVDVVIVGRGGGSMEDLWAFNEEPVARAIAACPKPVISAVGHETDTTIADFSADVRASTPSNAAELAVPARDELLSILDGLGMRMDNCADTLINGAENCLLRLRTRLERRNPERELRDGAKMLTLLHTRMEHVTHSLVSDAENRLAAVKRRLDPAMDEAIRRRSEACTRLRLRLDAVDPGKVLERGYAIVTAGRKLIATTAAAEAAGRMTVRFRDGSVHVRTDGGD